MPGEAVAGPSRAAHPSDSCRIGLIEIDIDFESLEVVSAMPAESIAFSPDGRLPHIASLIRAAAWVERCAVIEDTCTIVLACMEGFAGRLAAISGERRPLLRRAVRIFLPRY